MVFKVLPFVRDPGRSIGDISLEPDAAVVQILAVLSREVPGVGSNKSIPSSSSLEFVEVVIDRVLAGCSDCHGLNPLEPKSLRGFACPGSDPHPWGRACMRKDGSESTVRPVKESWRSTCSILCPLSLRTLHQQSYVLLRTKMS